MTSSATPSIEPPKAKTSVALRLVELVGFAVLIVSLLGFAGAMDWRIDLFSHFRFQYVLILAATTLATLALRSWRTAGVLAVGLVINAATLLPLFIPKPVDDTVVAASNPPIRMAAINVRTENQSFNEVVQYVIREQPDVVFFQETNRAWISALTSGLYDYRAVQQRARDDNFGVLLMVRRPSESSMLAVMDSFIFTLAPGAANVPSVDLRLRWNNRAMHVLCVHTVPPVNESSATGRDIMLVNAAKWVAANPSSSGGTVILGDLNATPWCASYRKLMNESILVDSARGFGWQPSWPSALIALGSIPIDHCLHSGNWVTIRREVDRAGNGSDHFPLLVELAPNVSP